MKEFNYIIIGGGCAGLSLAYELEINKKLEKKKLAIIEPRERYQRDKLWSFWKFQTHNYDDCVLKSWDKFDIKAENKSQKVDCQFSPYQTIDSGLFYKKILNKLKKNSNINFFKSLSDINVDGALIFNSVWNPSTSKNQIWQHFYGVEIETKEEIFDDEKFTLMDFNCEQRDKLHFFYILPFTKNKALIETTWFSKIDNTTQDYEFQINDYLKNNLKIKSYLIKNSEKGKIPLFSPDKNKSNNTILIGTAGGATRLSTGYTFLNIQAQSAYIRENLDNIKIIGSFSSKKKYQILDKIFLKVLRDYPHKMPNIFFQMFNGISKAPIKFLSNKSNFFDDLLVIMRMPKFLFLKSLFAKKYE